MKSRKKVNETATGTIKQQDRRIKQNERELNDLQQYSRRWNLRVFKVPEKEKETAADCTAKVCAIFSDKVGIPITASDIEVAHRTGQRSSTRVRPIFVRFFDRKKRNSVPHKPTQPQEQRYCHQGRLDVRQLSSVQKGE